jgi:hypothetical protein
MAITRLKPHYSVDDPFAGVNFPELEHSLRRPRTFMDFVLNGAVTLMTLFGAEANVSAWIFSHSFLLHLWSPAADSAMPSSAP